MLRQRQAESEIFTAQEIARAAGVAAADVQHLLAAREAVAAGGRYVRFEDAVRLVRLLRRGDPRPRADRMFAPVPAGHERRATPLLVSGVLHAALIAAVAVVAGHAGGTAATEQRVQELPRLIFIATPGLGGGGGGGGQRQPQPPAQARSSGRSPVRSPVTVARIAEPRRTDSPVAAHPPAPGPEPAPEPPPSAPAVTPPVVAPVASAAADEDDERGTLTASEAAPPSSGPGAVDGAGTGRGTGLGEGDGAGVGDGSIGGTGGGPYRPGSGITPPSLIRELKPIYTEEGRRSGVEGDVLLEVVVLADGTVGAVRIVRGLGAGLDERAVDAVRQWVFSPARRFGVPVDVLVEVAVEFRLR
jgi:periplasmic protein TonB